MTGDVAPVLSALRRRSDQVVEHVLRENESRWESLSEADRRRLEVMTQEVASRLLHEPSQRLEAAGGDSSSRYVKAMGDLFGLGPDELRSSAY